MSTDLLAATDALALAAEAVRDRADLEAYLGHDLMAALDLYRAARQRFADAERRRWKFALTVEAPR